jgi:hypothetical protein
MKKLILIVILLVSLGLVGGVFAQPASAFLFKSGGPFGFFGAKSSCMPSYGAPCAPYYYAPYYSSWAPYACKPRKAKKKASAMKQKPPKAEKKKMMK